MPRIEAIDRGRASGASLGSLSQATGISKATAYRALSTLRGRGFVTQDASGDYVLGQVAVGLGEQFLGGEHLAVTLKPVLVELSRQAEELVHLGTWDGDHVIYLDKVEPAARAIRVWSSVGQRVPVASSSLGRALLGAQLRNRIPLTHYIGALPPNRPVSEARLESAIDEMRSSGFSSEFEENEPGVACLGTALIRDDAPIAAISITSLASRMTPQRVQRLKELVRAVVPPLLPEGITLYIPVGH